MSGIVQCARAKVDDACVVTQIDKEGCSVSLDRAPVTRLILDLDEPGSPIGPGRVRCDYLFFAEDAADASLVAALELKQGQFRASKFAEQLNAGAQAAEQLVTANISVKFRPIAVYGGTLHIAQRRRLKWDNNRVSFRGRCESLRLMKCGEELTNALR